MSTRSHLYVPANDLERLKKSIERGADALIIDLEDGVSVNDKDLARENLANWLELSSSQGQNMGACES
jgi:citrate lyase subunit beta / citryl-CoA lyase